LDVDETDVKKLKVTQKEAADGRAAAAAATTGKANPAVTQCHFEEDEAKD
jgi:hypothetical protein